MNFLIESFPLIESQWKKKYRIVYNKEHFFINKSTLMIWRVCYKGCGQQAWWEQWTNLFVWIPHLRMDEELAEVAGQPWGNCFPRVFSSALPTSLRFALTLFYMQSTVPSPHTSFSLPQTYSNLSTLKSFFLDSDFTSWSSSFLLIITFQFTKGKAILSPFPSLSLTCKLSALWLLPHLSRQIVLLCHQ